MKLIENNYIEIKREIKFNDDIAKEIIAFANTDGGKIYIGIDDDGTVIGVIKPDETSQKISNIITDSIEKDLKGYISIENEIIGDKDVIVIHIAKGSDRPYYLKSKGIMPSGVYVRMGTTKKQASDELIKKMIFDSSKITFEKSTSPEQDLTFEYFTKKAKELGIKIDNVKLKNLGLVNVEGKYNYAALLISDQNPVDVRCARFKGLDKLKFIDKLEIEGSIISQIDEVMRYVKINNRTDVEITGNPQRDEYPSYPEEAIREAVINAIIHRDYFIDDSVMIAFFDDRLEIVSQGTLYGDMTIERMFDGETVLRNPILARVMHKIEYVEHWGTGIKRIQDAYANFFIKPKFEELSMAVRMTLYDRNYNNRSFATNKVQKEDLNEQEKVILEYILKYGNITRSVAEKELGIKASRTKEVLAEMVKRNLIYLIGKGKNSQYKSTK